LRIDQELCHAEVQAMTYGEITQFFRTQQDAWSARDAEALSRGHAENGTVVSPIFRTVVGRGPILESYRSLFSIFPDWKLEPDALLIDGQRAAQPFSVAATHVGDFMGIPGSGKKCEIQGVRIFEMGDGLIAYERRVYDFTGLLIQLGILRGKPVRV
jgi:steroid delta-isomerase-like uncharacterized protein